MKSEGSGGTSGVSSKEDDKERAWVRNEEVKEVSKATKAINEVGRKA